MKFKTILSLSFIFCSGIAQAQNPGDVIITEILANPTGTDITSEWFELYNTTKADIDIKGWLITDLKYDSAYLSPSASLIIKAESFLVLGNNSNPATNGQVNVDYQYAGFTLNNTNDAIELQNSAGKMIDHVEYLNPVVGVAYNLDPGNYDHQKNDSSYYWCLATQLFNSTDKGTPGQENTSCNLSNMKEPMLSSPAIALKEGILEIHETGIPGSVYRIFDLTGKCVINQRAQPDPVQTIGITSIHAGIYYLVMPGNRETVRIFIP